MRPSDTRTSRTCRCGLRATAPPLHFPPPPARQFGDCTPSAHRTAGNAHAGRSVWETRHVSLGPAGLWLSSSSAGCYGAACGGHMRPSNPPAGLGAPAGGVRGRVFCVIRLHAPPHLTPHSCQLLGAGGTPSAPRAVCTQHARCAHLWTSGTGCGVLCNVDAPAACITATGERQAPCTSDPCGWWHARAELTIVPPLCR